MRPEFKIADLGFVMQVSASENFQADDQTQDQIQSLVALARALKQEQDTMRAHKAVALRDQTQRLAAECEFQHSLKLAVQRVWDEISVFYQCHSCKFSALQTISPRASCRPLASRRMCPSCTC